MSGLNQFIIYDTSNYKIEQYKTFNDFKGHFLLENNNPFLFLDPAGNEFDQDTINQIKVDENQRIKYILYYYNNNGTNYFQENNADQVIINQLAIDEILTSYLRSKKTNLEKSKEVCDDIVKRYEDYKEDKDRIDSFVDNYGKIYEKDKECSKYIYMIKNSPKEIEILAPKFQDIIEKDINVMFTEVMNKINKIMKIEISGKHDIKSFEQKKRLYEEYNSAIKNKLLNIINNQELICSIQKKMNEVLIYAEKLNFFLNLSEIPNIYNEDFKKKLKKEYKRRNQFNNLYDKIMDFIKNDLICKEYEERKRFIKDIFKDLNFSNNLDNEKNIENKHHLNKLKIEKKTINILNKLIDYEAQQLFISETQLYKSNYDLADDLTRSIDELTEYLNKISEEIFSKKKKNIDINNKNKSESLLNKENSSNIKNNQFSEPFGEIKQIIRNSSIPELSQNKIISILENKILNQNIDSKNKNYFNLNNNSLSDDLLISSFDYISAEKDPNKQNQMINKIIQSFSDIYGNYLWFYEKVYNYLKIYKEQCDKNDILLDKADPCSVNNYLIVILNENKSLKDQIKNISNCT